MEQMNIILLKMKLIQVKIQLTALDANNLPWKIQINMNVYKWLASVKNLINRVHISVFLDLIREAGLLTTFPSNELEKSNPYE